MLNAQPSNVERDEINKIKFDLLNEYPFVTKIDTTVITVLDVKKAPLDWGFWIKIICHCVYGYNKVNQKFQNLDKVKSQGIHVLA